MINAPAHDSLPRTGTGRLWSADSLKVLCIALLLPIGMACQNCAWADATAPVVVSGNVPDVASKAAILGKLGEIYGADRVVDRLKVSSVSAPAGWVDQVQRVINSGLKVVHSGELSVSGSTVTLKGFVDSDTVKRKLVSDNTTLLQAPYTLNDQLQVQASEQHELDATLANRIVEFQSGSALLTDTGKGILDQMAQAIAKLNPKRVEIIGHTDSDGSRASNIVLSEKRAEAVRDYLIGKGVPAATLATKGVGPDQPVASNDTPEGKRQNRRIEFRIES